MITTALLYVFQTFRRHKSKCAHFFLPASKNPSFYSFISLVIVCSKITKANKDSSLLEVWQVTRVVCVELHNNLINCMVWRRGHLNEEVRINIDWWIKFLRHGESVLPFVRREVLTISLEARDWNFRLASLVQDVLQLVHF